MFVSNQHQPSTVAFAQDTTPTTGNQTAAPASGYKDANFRDLDNSSWVLSHWTNGDGTSHPGFPQDPNTSNPITLDLKTTNQGRLSVGGNDGSNAYSGVDRSTDGKTHFPTEFGHSLVLPRTNIPDEYRDELAHVVRTEVQGDGAQRLRLTAQNGDSLEFDRQHSDVQDSRKPAPADGYRKADKADLDNTSWDLIKWTNPDGKTRPALTAQPVTLDLKSGRDGSLTAEGSDGEHGYSSSSRKGTDSKSLIPDTYIKPPTIDQTTAPAEYLHDLSNVTAVDLKKGDPQHLRLTIDNGETLEFARRA